jgi:hypothetical protein
MGFYFRYKNVLIYGIWDRFIGYIDIFSTNGISAILGDIYPVIMILQVHPTHF